MRVRALIHAIAHVSSLGEVWVASLICPRPLTILNPLDHNSQRLTAEAAEITYSTARQAYRQAGVDKNLQIVFGDDLGAVL
jgi:hypothetical protein